LPGFANLALVAAYGFEEGRDATAEAFAYAWEHWERVRQMPSALGYLFRVAQSRRRRRRVPMLYDVAGWPDHLFEPGLPGALAALASSGQERISYRSVKNGAVSSAGTVCAAASCRSVRLMRELLKLQ
jgi:hypothetical protein